MSTRIDHHAELPSIVARYAGVIVVDVARSDVSGGQASSDRRTVRRWVEVRNVIVHHAFLPLLLRDDQLEALILFLQRLELLSGDQNHLVLLLLNYVRNYVVATVRIRERLSDRDVLCQSWSRFWTVDDWRSSSVISISLPSTSLGLRWLSKSPNDLA